MAKWAFKVFEFLKGPGLFENVWHLLTRVSQLTEEEVDAASAVMGPSGIKYSGVRVAEGRLLKLVFKFNGNRAFTTFRTINLPASGHHARSNRDIIVHELVHVFQFNVVGSIYIWQSLRAQRMAGYGYGGWSQLADDWSNGKHLRDYNREQQGHIAQDYYRDVVEKELPMTDPIRQAFEPFIDELRNGNL